MNRSLITELHHAIEERNRLESIYNYAESEYLEALSYELKAAELKVNQLFKEMRAANKKMRESVVR